MTCPQMGEQVNPLDTNIAERRETQLNGEEYCGGVCWHIYEKDVFFMPSLRREGEGLFYDYNCKCVIACILQTVS